MKIASIIWPSVLMLSLFFIDSIGSVGAAPGLSPKGSVIVEGGTDAVAVNFHFNPALGEKEKITGKDMATFTGLPLAMDPGRPQLPYFVFFLLGNPQDFQLDYELGDATTVKSFVPTINPEKPCRCGDYHRLHDKDEEMEEEARADKNEPYRLDYLGDFKGVPITRLIIFPQKLNQKERSLTLYPELALQIRRLDGKRPEGHTGYLDAIAQGLRSPAKGNTILVVTPERWMPSLDKWAQWKKRQGFTVRFASLEKIGMSATNIREYLYRQYASPQTTYQYAILVGHEKLLPTFYVRTSSDEATPSDLPYFTMGGKDDHIPDVLYGRLVADSEEDLQLQVEKIIDYEKAATPADDPSGYARGVGIASDEGQNPSDVDYLMAAQRPFTDEGPFQFANFLQKDDTSDPENINTAIEKGVSWINYIGHGSGHSWASLYQQEYTSQDVAALRPAQVRPVVIDVSCLNGRFLYDGHLGERFMNEKTANVNAPLGAVAYYGGSVDISWDPPALMAQGISRAFNENQMERLGQGLLAGQMSLYGKVVDTKAIQENFTWYNLLGDPTLFVRKGPLTAIQASVSPDKRFLLLRDGQNSPLASVPVVFAAEGGSLQTVQSDAKGKVGIPNPTKSKSFYILTKGHPYLEGNL